MEGNGMNCVERSLNSRADLISLVLSLTCLRFPALHGWYDWRVLMRSWRWGGSDVQSLQGVPWEQVPPPERTQGFPKPRPLSACSEKPDALLRRTTSRWAAQQWVVKKVAGSADLQWSASGRKEKCTSSEKLSSSWIHRKKWDYEPRKRELRRKRRL